MKLHDTVKGPTKDDLDAALEDAESVCDFVIVQIKAIYELFMFT